MGIKPPYSRYRVIRGEGIETSPLSSDYVAPLPIGDFPEALFVNQKEVEALNSQLRASNVKIELLHKEAAEMRSKLSQGTRIVQSTVEKIVEIPTDKIIEKIVEVEKVKFIKEYKYPQYYLLLLGVIVGLSINYLIKLM